MNDLLSEFEQQFSCVTADITSKTSSLLNNNSLSQEKVCATIKEIKILVEDAIELIEHMELEVRDSPQDQREKLQTRVKSYEVELKRLEAEFIRSQKRAGEASTRLDLFDSDLCADSPDEPHQRLLESGDSLDRTSMRIQQSYKTALQSEEVGAQVLNDLHYQRNTLTHARQRLHETDVELNESSRVLSSMLRRALQNRFVVFAVLAGVVIFIAVILFVKLK